MKVLLVNTSETTGGAAIAASRLTEALRQNGVEARMLVRDKRTERPYMVKLPGGLRTRMHFYWERLTIWLHNGLSRRMLWYVDIANAGTDITHLPEFREADVIHLHWVNQGMLSLDDIEHIVHSGKRVVWTMHDQWPYTAVCHHSQDCRRFQTHCHSCPQLCRPSEKDLSSRVFARKLELMRGARVTFVGCSRWISSLAATSALLQEQRVETVPNAVPPTFRPMDRTEARRRMGLPLVGRLVLFGACKVSDRRKGADYMIAACRLLRHAADATLVIVGGQGQWMRGEVRMPVIVTDYIAKEEDMAALYAAADVFVTPSLMENLPNTIAEAMSTGTPCVGFRTGGIPEMIDHLENGYVAQYRNVDDLARGIDYVLDHNLRAQARQKALATYAPDRVARQYIKIYEEQ